MASSPFPFEVKVTRLRDVPLPEYHSAEAAGFDLAISEAAHIPYGETRRLPTGLVIVTPPGHMTMIVPRSSTSKRWNLSLGNTVGIVDSDFCGPEDEMMLDLRNDGPSGIIVPAGTRLAQAIIVPVIRAKFVEVSTDELAQSRGGWGSTGV